MSAEGHDDQEDHHSVKDKTCHGIRAEESLLHIPVPPVIDDMKDHRGQDEEHAKNDRAHEDRVDGSDARKRDHRLARPEPDSLDDILKSEDTSEHEAEERGGYPCQRDDSCKIDVFKFVEQEAEYRKAQALADVPVHDPENEGIRHRHKDRRIDLAVVGQSVHFHVHLVRLEDLRVPKLCRCPRVHLIGFLFDQCDALVVFCIFPEFSDILLRHPSADDVEGIRRTVVLRAGGHFPDVKIRGEELQLLSRSEEGRCVTAERFFHLLVQFRDLPVIFRFFLSDFPVDLIRRPLIFFREIEPLKMKRRKYRVHFVDFRAGSKINPVEILVILAAVDRDRIGIPKDIIPILIDKVAGDPAEATRDIAEIQDGLQVIPDILKGSQLFDQARQFLIF